MRDGPGQSEPGRPPGNETYGRSLQLRVGRLQHFRYRLPELTLCQSGSVIPYLTAVISRVDPDSNRRVALVYHRMIYFPRYLLDYQAHCHRCWRAPPHVQNAGDRRPQHRPRGTGRIRARQVDCNRHGSGVIIGYLGALSSVPMPMDPG